MKKILSVFILLLIVCGAYLAFLFFEEPNYEELNFVQKYYTHKVASVWEKKILEMPKDERVIVDYDTLMNSLGFFEKNFAKRIFNIDPKELGFKGPFYSRAKPTDLVEVQSVKLGDSPNARETGVQFCPKHSYIDYLRMAAKMKEDIGKIIFIDSGYRSPGRQAYLFIHYLDSSSKYSLKENARWIAMPGYSEHGHPVNNAIDFTNAEGINGFSNNQISADFEALPEYKWMNENAASFNFHLSYPKDNPYGVAFEPWHWHWNDKQN